MLPEIFIRPLNIEDENFLWQMIMYASHEPTIEAVKNQSYLAQYVSGWGRKGDMGFAAVNSNQLAGAAWIRLWSDTNRGFGYVDREIPELVVAVSPNYRKRGIGTRLIITLLENIETIYPAISLNVRENNPVVKLYERLGFTRIPDSDVINRTGGLSFTMVKTLGGE